MQNVKHSKRDRLVQAALAVTYQQGFQATTLADIAQHAEVPLGNVYYYFRTKEDLGQSLIESLLGRYQTLLQEWNMDPSPKMRIQALIDHVAQERFSLQDHGCPIGSLCTELNKKRGPLSDSAAQLFQLLLTWLENQFKAMGKPNEGHLALQTLSSLQGASLLAHSLHNPQLIEIQTEALSQWLETL
ncbi:MAG: TetR/AcrR family transcriptional regulator [Acidobacteria bacterium]|nr:TetR/AcrR family transcriptional regulator [Acidobacteriota bacterium]